MLDFLARYGNYFFPLQDYPLIQATYPPVFFAAALPFYFWLGPAMVTIRLVSMIATFLVAALVGIVARQKQGWPFTLFMSLLWMSIWAVQYWGLLGRVDMLAAFFSAAGVGWFWFYAGRGSQWKFMAFAFFILGFFTKQSAVLAPAAVFLYAAVRKEERRYLPHYLAVYGVPIAVLFLAANLYTRGQFYLHLFPYVATAGFDWLRASRHLLFFLGVFLPYFLSAAVLCIRSGRRIAGSRDLIFFLYFVLTFLGLFSGGRDGSNENYYLEPAAALFLWAASTGSWWEGKREKTFHAIIQLGQTLFLIGLLGSADFAYRMPADLYYLKQSASRQALDQVVKETRGDILSEEVGLMVTNHKPALIEPAPFPVLARKGLWDPATLIGDCRNGRFEVVIAGKQIMDIPGMPACLGERYRLADVVDRLYIFRRKAG